MEKKITHLKLRKAVKNNSKLILTGVYNPKTGNMHEDRYHESRAAIYEMYPEAHYIYKFMLDLNERKTYNPAYPLTVISRLLEEKCGETFPDGLIIATMIARGFKCNFDEKDPRFNVSSASPALA